MNLKKMFILICVLFLSISLIAGEKEFKKGTNLLTAEFGFSSFATPFGVSFERGITDQIGVGVSALFMSWGYDLGAFGDYNQTLIIPSAFAVYHFTKIDVKKLDVYAGASVGFGIYSSDWAGETATSSLFLSGIVGVRYYVSEKIAINFKESFGLISDWSGSYSLLGVTFKL